MHLSRHWMLLLVRKFTFWTPPPLSYGGTVVACTVVACTAITSKSTSVQSLVHTRTHLHSQSTVFKLTSTRTHLYSHSHALVFTPTHQHSHVRMCTHQHLYSCALTCTHIHLALAVTCTRLHSHALALTCNHIHLAPACTMWQIPRNESRKINVHIGYSTKAHNRDKSCMCSMEDMQRDNGNT